MDEQREGRERSGKWQPLFGGGSTTSRRKSHGVYSTVELQQLLEYERLRAERSGEPGSILVCYLNGNAASERRIRRLVSTVAHTVRETDHIGWVSESELAVVLPGTTTGDAASLKEKLVANGLLLESDVRVDSL